MSTSTLCLLPFDLIYIILSFSDWRDILSLARTSRRYYGIAHSLPVWIQAAQRIPKKYLIPKNTFSLDGLEVKELQQLVARPEQVRTGCRVGEEGFIRVREKACVLADSMWIHSAIVIPGGRWLITGHDLGRMKMWDLDAPLDSKDRFACVHSAQLPGCTGHLGVLLVQRSSDQNGVVVLTESLEHNEPKGYNLGVVEFTLDGPNKDSDPTCHTWGAFSGNDTIALEGSYVAAEHQGTTRIWDWKRKLFSAYRWDLSMSLHPHDHIIQGERIDITLQPPYVYLIHSRLRVFAAFRIPTMQEVDVFAGHADWHTPGDGTRPVDFIRPEIVLDLTTPYTLYHDLELSRPEGERFPYEYMRLTNITGVQFINPWSLQADCSRGNAIPFFITVSNSDDSRAYLIRYDVTQSSQDGYVNRPVLKQIIQAKNPQLDIVSPTLVTDDFGTIWGTERGLLYAMDSTDPPNNDPRMNPSLRDMDDPDPVLPRPMASKMIVYESSAHTMRHRVGFDAISGRKFKVLRTKIVISDYTPFSQAYPSPPSPDMHVDEV